MSTRNRIALIGLAITMAACGGGSSFPIGSFPDWPGSAPFTPPPDFTPINAGGVWEGSMFNNNAGLTFEIVGVVTENGTEARFVNDIGQQFIISDLLGVADSQVSIPVTAIAPVGSEFIDGSTTTSGTLVVTVVERTSIDSDWSLDTGETGTITMSYDALYERGSDLARTVGSWMDSVGVVYSVDATGGIFAQDALGCVYDGAVSHIIPLYNAYQVTLTVSSCPGANGDYSGLGVLADDDGTDDAFVILLDNGQINITDVLLKL